MGIRNLKKVAMVLAHAATALVSAQVGPENPKAGLMNTVTSRIYSDGNTISNGSFENETLGWSLGGGVEVSALPEGTRPWSGRRALSVEVPAGFLGSTLSTPVLPLPHTSAYTLSFYYMASGIPAEITVQPQLVRKHGPAAPSDLSLTGPPLSNNSSWTFYSCVFTNPTSAFGVVHLLNVSGTGLSLMKFSFDDVQLVEGDADLQSRTIRKVSFLDGMNRPLQSLVHDGTSDILNETRHDDLGRVYRVSLPFGHTAGHTYVPEVLDNIGSGSSPLEQYYSSGSLNAGGFAFNQIFYEDSPLGRVKESWGAGAAWRTNSRGIRHFYGSTDLLPEDWLPGLEPIVDNSHLFVQMIQGEDGEVTREYKDRLGRMVKKEDRLETRWISTTYGYDDNNNLTSITAPPGYGGSVVTTNQAFNSLNRKIWEDSPDFGFNEFIYDQLGRLRFSRTTSEAENSTFTYHKYDVQGRLVETGEVLENSLFSQPYADNAQFPEAGQHSYRVRTVYLYDAIPKLSPVCGEPSEGEKILIYPDAPPGSQTEFPDLGTAIQSLRSRFAGLSSYGGTLDIYQLFPAGTGTISPPPGLEVAPFPLSTPGQSVPFSLIGVAEGSAEAGEIFPQPFPFPVAWGPIKGRLTQVFTCNNAHSETPLGVKGVSKTYNYDKYGSILAVYEYNGYIEDSDKRWGLVEQTFDKQRRLSSRTYYADPGLKTMGFSFTYSYDHEGRLHEIRDQAGSVVATHTYNAIGQLATLVSGPPGPGRVTYDYLYHFRGWPKRITATSGGILLFDQELKYEEDNKFNGNVASYLYTLSALGAPGTNLPASYAFQYDELNRLIRAGTTLSPGGGTIWDYTYADNGILLQREEDARTFDYIYASGTNQLDRVQTSVAPGERNTTGMGNFGYDENGRMVRDDSRTMTIDYDDNSDRATAFHRLEGTNAVVTYMVYDESGSRLSKIEYRDGQKIAAKHYGFGGKEIRESFSPSAPPTITEIYPFDSYGRASRSEVGDQYEVYIKNHLGSTVMVHNATTNEIAYMADYEPYGELRLQSSSLAQGLTPKFTGKELDFEIDLNYFGARYYDPDIGLWISPDPARQFHSLYTYVGNNPVNAIDPTGLYSMYQKADGSFGRVPEFMDLLSDNQASVDAVVMSERFENAFIESGNANLIPEWHNLAEFALNNAGLFREIGSLSSVYEFGAEFGPRMQGMPHTDYRRSAVDIPYLGLSGEVHGHPSGSGFSDNDLWFFHTYLRRSNRSMFTIGHGTGKVEGINRNVYERYGGAIPIGIVK